MSEGLIITVSAPSGTGKDTIARELVARDRHIHFFATATTRLPRAGEVDGEHYHFLDKEEFNRRVAADDFLEWIEYNDNYYGTLKSVIEEIITQGEDVISDLTAHGVKAMYAYKPQQTLRILFMPPSYEALINRLDERQKSSAENDIEKQRRIEQVKEDMNNWQKPGYVFTNPDLAGSQISDYDYVFINENLEETINKVLQTIAGERQRRAA